MSGFLSAAAEQKKEELVEKYQELKVTFSTFFSVELSLPTHYPYPGLNMLLIPSLWLVFLLALGVGNQMDLMAVGLLFCRPVESWINFWKSEGKRILRRIIDTYHIGGHRLSIHSLKLE